MWPSLGGPSGNQTLGMPRIALLAGAWTDSIPWRQSKYGETFLPWLGCPDTVSFKRFPLAWSNMAG